MIIIRQFADVDGLEWETCSSVAYPKYGWAEAKAYGWAPIDQWKQQDRAGGVKCAHRTKGEKGVACPRKNEIEIDVS